MLVPSGKMLTKSLLFLTFLTVQSSLTLQAEEWFQWRGPDRTGYLPYEGNLLSALPETGLKPAWAIESIASARDGGWGSPVIADGTVFLFSHKKELVGDPPGPKQFPYLAPEKRGNMTDEEYAEYEKNRRDEDEARAKAYQFREYVAGFDAQTGKELWTNESESTYSRFPQSGSPTVIGNRLFILGAGRQARCLDPRTGQELWKTPLPGEFRDEYYQASVLLVDQIAIFNSAQLFGLDIETGKIVWTGDPQKTKGTHASPVLWSKDGRNYVISLCANGHAICLDPQSGDVLWTIESEGGHASPVVVGDRLLVYGNSRKKGLHCYQLSPSGAESLWLYQRLTDKGSSPIVAQNRVYVQGERKLACLDLETGSQLWMANLDMENPQWGSPIAAGNVGFYAYDGLLAFSLAPEEYRQLFIAQINQEHLLASEQYFRDKFRLDDDSLDTEARKTALKNYQQEVGKSGPLKCSSPAFDNGRIYLRLANHLICYDLRAQP